jgi:acetyltransferase-like isoleucine patch superfamily enzyme
METGLWIIAMPVFDVDPDLLNRHVNYYAPHPEVHVGQLTIRSKDVFISLGARIDLTDDVTIDEYTMIGEGTRILTHDHYHEGRVPLLLLQDVMGVKHMPKTIGKDVWLHSCTVLMQVTDIPDGVVVGTGSVLTKIPGPYEIWAGNPAVKIGER